MKTTEASIPTDLKEFAMISPHCRLRRFASPGAMITSSNSPSSCAKTGVGIAKTVIVNITSNVVIKIDLTFIFFP